MNHFGVVRDVLAWNKLSIARFGRSGLEQAEELTLRNNEYELISLASSEFWLITLRTLLLQETGFTRIWLENERVDRNTGQLSAKLVICSPGTGANPFPARKLPLDRAMIAHYLAHRVFEIRRKTRFNFKPRYNPYVILVNSCALELSWLRAFDSKRKIRAALVRLLEQHERRSILTENECQMHATTIARKLALRGESESGKTSV